MAWKVDYAHSQIVASVRHMMISNVTGTFDKFTIDAKIDEKNIANSHVNVQIDAASVNTKMEQRDAHLKSPDFLNTAEYPYITFTSRRFEVVNSHHGRIAGDLTIRDVTRPVVLEVEYAGQARSPFGTINAGFSATAKVSRKDWGLEWNAALESGGWLVGDEVKINIDVEFIKEPEPVVQDQPQELVTA